MALGVLRALHEAGRRIPADVSVVGFDDVPEAAYFTPPLTTVRQDFDEMGHRGLKLLLETMEDPDGPPRHLEVTPELIVRSSTGATRALDASHVSANIALASLGRSEAMDRRGHGC